MSVLTPAIEPTRESVARFAEQFPAGQPVVMLNLLRFREQASYADASIAPCSGRRAYAEYSRLIEPILAGCGAQVLWVGKSFGALIAPPGEEWDEVLLVRYPSSEAFIGMIRSPAYRAIVHHRSAALADSRLVPNSQVE
ncbi:DUF1330 domain-containing protein [Pseudomonas sp. N040]|uniref:DUF1330 domain-containing protein n=1 Tax=Pseudomonas sp. N040 TaxID=2785325 RepID=UPI0018A32947|nr:DUF1330 domain-containing protein [Pseudomonas sp. N040]MBF7731368.1 DUF1330 domain-containing protein [Pseudomonas sp. N040]MBW7015011.1 DUF1330 domain-containing protein [Pseudomonas sp. N040]